MSQRDDIARVVGYGTVLNSDDDAITDAILALPAMQAREAVIEAARAETVAEHVLQRTTSAWWLGDRIEASSAVEAARVARVAAVAALDALEG